MKRKNNDSRALFSLKALFKADQNWYRFYLKNCERLRPAIVENILKLLSCRHYVRGYDVYRCSNPTCGHTKIVAYSCHSRFCSTCGYKKTMQWIEEQMTILPHCPWQHMVFTLPKEYRPLFWTNRFLLNDLSRIAANLLQEIAQSKGINIGIFTALHTFGRTLSPHVHIHLSVTLGGLTMDNSEWKSIRFSKDILMKKWRYAIITWLRESSNRDDFILPNSLESTDREPAKFENLLERDATRYWHVYLKPPSKDPKHNIEYLGRYIKRPPIAMSQLLHYNGQDISFRYRNHRTNRHDTERLSIEAFIGRLIRHIPDKYFRLIRYYGFLAHAVRGKLLPLVRQRLQQAQPESAPSLSWVELSLASFGIDPLECILCHAPMLLAEIHIGATLAELRRHHRALACSEKIVC